MPGTRFIDNVNGSDTTGDGLSIGTAYASIARAVQDAVDTSFVFLIADTGVTYVEDATSLPWPRASYQGVSSAGLPDIVALPHITFNGAATSVLANGSYIKSLWFDGGNQVSGFHAQFGNVSDVQYCRLSNFVNTDGSPTAQTIRPVRAFHSLFDNNAGYGADCSSGSAVGCIAYNNGTFGIRVGSANATNCIALNNGQDGITMWGAATIGTYSNCISMYNNWSGFRLNHGVGCHIDKSISAYNGQYGFNCQNGTGNGYITNCIAYQNTSGVLRDSIPVDRPGPITSEIFFGNNGTSDDQFTAVHNLSVSDPGIVAGATPPFELDMDTTSPAYRFASMPPALAPVLSTPHGSSALSIGASMFDLFPTGSGGGSPVTHSWWG